MKTYPKPRVLLNLGFILFVIPAYIYRKELRCKDISNYLPHPIIAINLDTSSAIKDSDVIKEIVSLYYILLILYTVIYFKCI